ncbi:prephenate dehydrogenase [Burkholderiales bacterium]|nr:MAG: prephenate dehydrogenase/arogenate dehydrogenase family protein [Burkholderiales bacterium]CAG0990627.1 prephenate dehydrogenase [Burkholderiales bacterium]
MSLAPVSRLVVVGVGLIGGSFALALRRAGLVHCVVGVGRSSQNLAQARDLGIIDHATADWREALTGADFVLVATPVAQMGRVFAAMAPHLEPEAVVTDGGSTKQDVVALARQHLAEHFSRFVPGHPIAGTEFSGAAAAFPELYRQRNVVLAPLAETRPEARQRVAELWQACGAVIRELPPERHDAIFAAVSHLPHMLAFTLVSELAARPDAEEYFRFAASGFRDFTRIASSHPEMWRDICLANRNAVREEIARFQTELARIDELLAANDGAGLEHAFDRARTARNAWLATFQKPAT